MNNASLLCLLIFILITSSSLVDAKNTSANSDTVTPLLRTEKLADNFEITLTTYPANSKYLILWIASGSGFRPGHKEIASRLAKQGMEVWLANVADALFIPKGSTSMRQLKGNHVADLVARAHQVTGKQIVLASNSYGAIPVLRGAHVWQSREPKKAYLAGVVLFSPSLYLTIPPLGLPPEYVTVVHKTTIPIMLYQSGRHGNRWQMPTLVKALRQGGSAVYTEIMPDLTSLFYQPVEAEKVQRFFAKLPVKFKNIISLLDKTTYPLTISQPVKRDKVLATGLDATLKKYQGNTQPAAITLLDVNNKRHMIKDYRGKVTVINFWATWCPPCVKEIPSLNRLRQKMAKDNFTLISINYAEDIGTIRKFMEKVEVDFPVLLDTDGKEAAKWGVIVFPSTFIIGPDGKIHYGVNAAIHWDTPEIINKLRKLSEAASH